MLSGLSIYKSPDPAGFHLRYFVAFCKVHKGKDGKLRQHKPRVQEGSHMTNDCSYQDSERTSLPNVPCPGNQELWTTSWLLTWKTSRPPKLKTNKGSSHQDFQMLSQPQKLSLLATVSGSPERSAFSSLQPKIQQDPHWATAHVPGVWRS